MKKVQSSKLTEKIVFIVNYLGIYLFSIQDKSILELIERNLKMNT